MKVFLRLLLVVQFAMAPSLVWAACVGQDMLPDLRAEDPQGIKSMFDRAHAQPNAQGRFWKIERAGTTPSFLFGTFHASEVVDGVPDQVWSALDAARIAVFELSEAEQDALGQRVATDPTFRMDMSSEPLLDDLTAGQREVLTRALAARGIPVQNANHMRPWLLASLLGFPPCHFKSMHAGAQILDKIMADRASENGIEAAGLETYEEALKAFSGLDRAVLLKILVADDWILNHEEDIFRTNAVLYSRGETAVINEFSIWLGERMQRGFDPRALNRMLMADLLDQRNQNWMDPLMGHLNGGNAFIGVGALHLPGKVGLIELLRDQGYTVTRLD